VLTVLVILAAAVGGTSKFTGARWLPNFGGSSTGLRTGTTMAPVTGGSGQRAHLGTGAVPTWLVVTVLALMAIALTVFAWRWSRGGRLPTAPELARSSVHAATQHVVESDPEPEPVKLLTGIELALVVLDQEREPADAVVRAWLGLQETAEESGILRRAAETPTEFTSRILSGAFVDDQAVSTLLRLYLRTRFGDHPVTAQDVADVRDALQLLVSSWQPSGDAPAARAR
jgi:hypothetical protein